MEKYARGRVWFVWQVSLVSASTFLAGTAAAQRAGIVEKPQTRVVNDSVFAEGIVETTVTSRGRDAASDADLLRQAADERRLQERIIRTEITHALSQARRTMRSDPQGAIVYLKAFMETVTRVPDLEAGARAELIGRLQTGLRQGNRRRIEKDRLDEVERANLSNALARQRATDAATRKSTKVTQLLAQVHALLDEERYSLAEQVALQAHEEAPELVASEMAVGGANLLGNYHLVREAHHARREKYVAALLEIERSAVAFPDNPPIMYPDADRWRALTERRKQWTQVDLAQSGPAERRIAAELTQPIGGPQGIDFSDTPLTEVMAFLEEIHGIQVEIDARALDDIQIDPSTESITRALAGISLRSGVRLMLRDLGLTYVIRDEVLMITTEEEAEIDMVTKVYPVGDLVIPIGQMSMMGGGMMGGGMMGGGMGGGMMGGGMGGGMMGGGMGGGMMGGGMGGGMMGGGMGGMGGGFFDLHDELTLGASKRNACQPIASAFPPGDVQQADTLPD